MSRSGHSHSSIDVSVTDDGAIMRVSIVHDGVIRTFPYKRPFPVCFFVCPPPSEAAPSFGSVPFTVSSINSFEPPCLGDQDGKQTLSLSTLSAHPEPVSTSSSKSPTMPRSPSSTASSNSSSPSSDADSDSSSSSDNVSASSPFSASPSPKRDVPNAGENVPNTRAHELSDVGHGRSSSHSHLVVRRPDPSRVVRNSDMAIQTEATIYPRKNLKVAGPSTGSLPSPYNLLNANPSHGHPPVVANSTSTAVTGTLLTSRGGSLPSTAPHRSDLTDSSGPQRKRPRTDPVHASEATVPEGIPKGKLLPGHPNLTVNPVNPGPSQNGGNSRQRHKWYPHEEDELLRLVSYIRPQDDYGWTIVAERLGRTVSGVKSRHRQLTGT